MINRADKLAYSAVGHTEIGKEFAGLVRRQLGEFALNLSADDYGLDAKMGRSDRSGIPGGGEFVDCADMGIVGLGEFVLADVAGKNGGLGGEEEKTVEHSSFVVRESGRKRRPASIEVWLDFFAEGQFSLGKLVARAGAFLQALGALLHSGQVCQDKLCGYHLNVSHRVNRTCHVVDICALKAADNLHDGINFANMAEKLVTEPFPSLAPFTSPAMSTNSMAAGMTF